ncbi:cytochrome c maturation protein CcmE [Marivibrio halodurans]|uniref:Cytochrome c-type biogenesis protein CcmE n=1 Tax=Marivibrio halodurans TaxID=2039722 RepID=A0A8J7S0H8_9PROT|nr:cytochrome c maturation protein CcmE [Marivibrio halodurans]MBP5858065.1 cytochrome c maturation protein CcmE [Marivibrio halodurans]
MAASGGRGLSPARRRKRTRLYLVLGGLAFLALAVGLVLAGFRDNIVFFFGPSEVAAGKVDPGRTFRLGGLVKDGSLARPGGTDGAVLFTVTDNAAEVRVRFAGLLPDLFREGQGIVALGALDGEGLFVADEVLAKHDENYMPAEAVEAMKRAGTWQHGEGGPGTAEPGYAPEGQ